MKYYIVLLLAICFSLINAQDKEVSPMKFTYKYGDTTFVNKTFKPELLKQKNFVISTQWEGHPRVLKALLFNYNQGWHPNWGIPPLRDLDSSYKLKHIWDNRNYEYIPGCVFEPTLYIPENKRDELVVRKYDTTLAVWGFSHVKGTILPESQHNDDNYNRLILKKDSLSSYSSDSIVLKNSWMNNLYSYNSGDPNYPSRNGKWMKVSINLRRLNTNEVCNNNDTLLTIKLPYSLKLSNNNYVHNYIKFSQIPSSNIYDTTHLCFFEDRGISLNMTNTSSLPQSIAILNSILPDSIRINRDSFNKDITINAFFNCDGAFNNNPKLRNDILPYIDCLDIEVKYYGKTDIAIDWLRITSPFGDSILVGYYDQEQHNIIQNAINLIEGSNYEIGGFYGGDEVNESGFTCEHHIARMYNYCTVTEGAGGGHFDHYMHNINPMHLWDGANAFWSSKYAPFVHNNWNDIDNGNIKPYYRLNYPGCGLKGNATTFDTLHSCYETDMEIENSTHYIKNSILPWWYYLRQDTIENLQYLNNYNGGYECQGANAYQACLMYVNSLQPWIERGIYLKYYNNFINRIYTDVPWWANQFLTSFWQCYEDFSNQSQKYWAVLNDYGRPCTGEEVRFLISNSIIFGAKGLAYDAYTGYFPKKNEKFGVHDMGFLGDATTFQPNVMAFEDTSSLHNLIYSNDMKNGFDFIPGIDSIYNYTVVTDRDSSAKYLGVKKDRVYVGQLSSKQELFKTHSWIRANDSLLMSLRLMGTYSKGFRIWQSYDTARFSSNPIYNFLKLDNRMIIFNNDSSQTLVSDIGIKTRPIDRTHLVNGVDVPYYEPWDSSFVDVTIHRQKDIDSNKIVFLGIQNRRTDPLVRPMDCILRDASHGINPDTNKVIIGCDTIDPCMKFYSTAEFDLFCDKGGNKVMPDSAYNSYFGRFKVQPSFGDTTYWRDLYWKRLGCRYITIPFNCHQYDENLTYLLTHPNSAYNGTICNKIRISELRDSSALNLNWPWWKRDKWARGIDTVIPKNTSAITLKMLPGEGRMFKLELLLEKYLNDKADPSSIVVASKQGNNYKYSPQSMFYVRQDTNVPYDPNVLDKSAFATFNTNQNNLVVFPITVSGTEHADTVRYHTAYMKRAEGDSLYQVYYRRSVKYHDSLFVINPDTLDNITWEKEICVSKRVYVGGYAPISNAMHPSIVVRKDTNNITKAYIIYAKEALPSAKGRQNYICQTILKMPNDVLDTTNVEGCLVSLLNGELTNEYGTPVINASKNINIVAWADSLYGIRTAQMSPSDVNGSKPAVFADLFWSNANKAKHPAVNVYSTFTGANDCSIVWQEDINLNGKNQIMHARIGLDYSAKAPYEINVLSSANVLNQNQVVNYNSNKKIAWLSYNNDQSSNHTLPVILRSQKTYYLNGTSIPENSLYPDSVFFERVAWTKNSTSNSSLSTMEINISNNWKGNILTPKGIKFNSVDAVNSISGIRKPSITQGIVNDTTENAVISFETSTDSTIYLLGTKYYTCINGFNPSIKETIKGYNTHLSQHKEEYTNGYWRNRLIAQVPIIFGDNQNGMARGSFVDKKKPECFIGYTDSVGKHTINSPIVNGHTVKLNLPYGYTNDTIFGTLFTRLNSDTIYSNWFEVGSNGGLSFNFIGLDTSKIGVILQKNSNNQIYNLPIEPSSGNYSGVNEYYTLLNGQNYNYRLAYIRKDSTTQYTEETYLEGIPIENIGYERTNSSKVINLCSSNSEDITGLTVRVFPNPAEDVIYATAYGNHSDSKLVVRVFSQLGIEIFSITAISGETITINTSQFGSGSYIIKVDENAQYEKSKSATEMFLIYR